MTMSVSLLGPPRVCSGDGSVDHTLPRKTLNVLAYLILHAKRPVNRDAVAFALFPDDDEETARANVRRNLSYLLSALPPSEPGTPFILATFEQLAWNARAPVEIDVHTFERAIAEGRDDDAIASYAGELLPTLYDEWTVAERERLANLFHDALTRTICRDRSMRRFDRAAELARRLLEEDPWREDIVRQLMAIRYESGDRAGALAIYERFNANLRAEMNAEPMPETEAMRVTILRGLRLASSPARHRSEQQPGVVTLPFVGRANVMAAALDQWHVAADGRPSVLFLSGRAGIGKSRVALELSRAIEREGGIVIRGETTAGGEHRPYESLIDALKNATPLLARSRTERTNDVWQAVLDELLAEQTRATSVDDRAARVRLFESVRRGFNMLAATRPVAIVLEDLHWAGHGTIDLLEYVATRLEQHHLLLIATFRCDELPAAHPLRALHRHLRGRGIASEIALDPLTADEALAALRAASPDTLDSEAAAQAIDRAEGIPLLLSECMRDIAAGREAPPKGGIDELFGSRLARLSPSAASALIYAAVIGARFNLDTLGTAMGWNDAELVDALGESIDLGLVRASAGTPGIAFSFTHHLAHEIALERLPARERELAHALVARALSAAPGSRAARAAEVARHYRAAGNRGKAAPYFLEAARHALAVFANTEAIDTATEGLALAEHLPDGSPELAYDLLDVRERAYARVGALAEQRADVRALYDNARNDPERAASALERIFEVSRHDASVRAETLEKLAALAPFCERNLAVYERILSLHAYDEGDHPTARDAAARAFALFERLGDSRAAFSCRAHSLNVLRALGDLGAVQNEVAAMREAYETGDDIETRMHFHRFASAVLTESDGRVGLADARISRDLALRIGDRLGEARARHNIAYYLNKSGEHGEALHEQLSSLDAYREMGARTQITEAMLNVATMRGFCGDVASAESLLSEIDAEALESPITRMFVAFNRANFAIWDGRMERADLLLGELRENVTTHKLGFWSARTAVLSGEFYACIGHDDGARRSLDEALAYLESVAPTRELLTTYAICARFRAGIGDSDAARTYAQRAVELSDRLDAYQHVAKRAWHLAATYAMLDDREAATTFAQRAAKAFATEAMRMDPEIAEHYARLPWHVDIFGYLGGREVPLRFTAAVGARPQARAAHPIFPESPLPRADDNWSGAPSAWKRRPRALSKP
jgi:DNA-binding SARP family transcriptional activator